MQYLRETYNYNKLKELALACRNKNKGKMLDNNFRLHYDSNNKTVTLYNRYATSDTDNTNSNAYAITYPSNDTLLNVSGSSLIQSVTMRISNMYRVYISSIQGNAGIKLNHSHWITDINSKRSVYIPGITTVNRGNIISKGHYKKTTIDKEWSKNYTQRSKRNRASITALHRIVPALPNNYHKSSAYDNLGVFKLLYDVLDIMLDDKPITTEVLFTIRKSLGIYHNDPSIRSFLQKALNDYRITKATADGKIEIIYYDNSPK